MRLDLDVKVQVRDQITALLLANPEFADDDVLREDMIEGTTTTFEFLSKIVRLIGAAAATALGTEQYIKELQARCDRYERRRDVLRSFAFKVMSSADLSKRYNYQKPLSIRAGQPKVILASDDVYLRICTFASGKARAKVNRH